MDLQEKKNWKLNLTTGITLMILVIATFLGSAVGQTNQGSIAGNVSDPSGALIPNAKITAKGQSTGSTYETVTSSSGSYRVPNMNIGVYDITVAAAGFKTATFTGVVVQVATTAALDVKLTAGGARVRTSVPSSRRNRLWISLLPWEARSRLCALQKRSYS